MMIFNGLTGTTVSITGGLGVPVPNSTQSLINVAVTTNAGAQDAYTVTAGKTFYLMAVAFYVAAGTVTIYKTDGATRVLAINNTTVNWNGFAPSCPIWAYAAGEIVKVNGTNNGQLNLIGVEV